MSGMLQYYISVRRRTGKQRGARLGDVGAGQRLDGAVHGLENRGARLRAVHAVQVQRPRAQPRWRGAENGCEEAGGGVVQAAAEPVQGRGRVYGGRHERPLLRQLRRRVVLQTPPHLSAVYTNKTAHSRAKPAASNELKSSVQARTESAPLPPEGASIARRRRACCSTIISGAVHGQM